MSAENQLLHIGFLVYSKTIPNCVLAKIQSHLVGVFLRQFQILPQSKFNCISSKLFYDNSELCLSPISNASHRNSCKMISNVVSAKIKLHLIGNILGQFQILSPPKFNRISSEFFWDNFKFCLSQKSIASHQISSATIPNFFLAQIQLHLIEILLRWFQMLSRPKFNCISTEIF